MGTLLDLVQEFMRQTEEPSRVVVFTDSGLKDV